MTITLDTPAQAMTHSALHGYAADMDRPDDNESQNITGALAVIDEMNELQDRLKEAMERRDAFIAKAHLDDGLRTNEIARLIGMSPSNVRLITDIAKRVERQKRPRHQ